MNVPILETRALTARFGGHVAVDAVTCAFRRGELCAIVGPNGAGKTTYFNVISGQLRASGGIVRLDGRDVTRRSVAARAKAGIGRAFQLTALFPGLTVLENVRLAVQVRRGGAGRWLARAATDRRVHAASLDVLEQVHLSGQARRLVAQLSHGDKRKLEVAMLIAMQPRVFMFDEPTAGMSVDDAPEILALIDAIRANGSACVLMVEHKMDVIRALADRVVVMHNGAVVADGAPATVLDSDTVREAYLGQGVQFV